MSDKNFIFRIALAEMAYARKLPDIWYSEKYYAKVKEIAP